MCTISLDHYACKALPSGRGIRNTVRDNIQYMQFCVNFLASGDSVFHTNSSRNLVSGAPASRFPAIPQIAATIIRCFR